MENILSLYEDQLTGSPIGPLSPVVPGGPSKPCKSKIVIKKISGNKVIHIPWKTTSSSTSAHSITCSETAKKYVQPFLLVDVHCHITISCGRWGSPGKKSSSVSFTQTWILTDLYLPNSRHSPWTHVLLCVCKMGLNTMACFLSYKLYLRWPVRFTAPFLLDVAHSLSVRLWETLLVSCSPCSSIVDFAINAIPRMSTGSASFTSVYINILRSPNEWRGSGNSSCQK